MTEEKKQELRQLLHEAMGKLIVLYEHRPSRITIRGLCILLAARSLNNSRGGW